MLMGQQQRGKQHIISTEVGSRSQSVIHPRSSKFMEESEELMQTTWIVCFNETVR